MAYRNDLLDRLGIALPILQAPLAGVASPALAAAVGASGALGALGGGTETPAALAREIAEARERHDAPLTVTLSCASPPASPDADAAWTEALRPVFAELGTAPPRRAATSSGGRLDDDMLRMLLAVKPRAVVFRAGAPPADAVPQLRAAGIVLMGCVTSLSEARLLADAGVDALIAQGWEASGPRATFETQAPDMALGTLPLTRMLVRTSHLPVVAAGGIMDGAGIAAALRLGASAACLGTAFIACSESRADADYRKALAGEAAQRTCMTRAVDGRPARCLPNRLTALEARLAGLAPPQPGLAHAQATALHVAGRRKGLSDYAPYWAGQGAPLSRPGVAADLIHVMANELAVAG